jgi:syntaxin-binding protein 5
LSVSYADISASLLLGIRPDPIQFNFPTKLPQMHINVRATLTNPSVARHFQDADIRITRVLFATESLDCAVMLSTGALILYHFQPGRPGVLPFRESESPLLMILDHVSSSVGSSYWPNFLLLPPLAATACAMCDTGQYFFFGIQSAHGDIIKGFLAVGYADGSMVAVDMRTPRVILQEQGPKSRHSIGIKIHQGHGKDYVVSLQWTVCPLVNGKYFRFTWICDRLANVG